jgi:hypothetical protein
LSERIRRHLTYANVMSTIAAFAAIGGGVAWALEANSVRSQHIVNGQVKRADLKDKAVRASKVKPNALDASHLAGVEELASSGLKVVDIPPLEDSAFVSLLTTPAFDLFGECVDAGGGNLLATLKVEGNDDGWSFDGDGSNGSTDSTGLPVNARQLIVEAGPTAGSHFATGRFTAAMGTQILTGIGSVATDDFGADCAFGLSALG